jgi:hypothetical protein
MIRLRQTFGAHAGRSLEFSTDVVTLGRLPESNIPFDPRADIDASGRHAELRRDRDGWMVVDVGSRNGTWVNGQRVDRALLKVGDELEFGRGGPRFVVDLAQPGAGAAPPSSALGLMPTAQWPATDAAVPNAAGVSSVAAGASGGSQPPPSFRAPASEPPPSFRAPPSQPPASSRTPISEAPRFRAPGGVSPPGGPSPAAVPTSEPPPRARGEAVPMYFVPSGGVVGAAGSASGSGAEPPVVTSPSGGVGFGLGAAIAIGLVALIFAGIAMGFLVSRLRGAAGEGAARTLLPPASAPAVLGARIGPAVYLVASSRTDGTAVGLCTAFAVRSDVAATSGRCVTLAEQERSRGARIALVRPGVPGSVGVATMYRHPQFDARSAAVANDVGVIRVAGALPAVVPLPTLDGLRAFAPGEPAYVISYVAADGLAPRPPNFAAGALGTPTHFDGTPGAFDTTHLLPHSARVEPGGSGAPVFDGAGVLVGVHASADVANPALCVRADVLLALLAGLGA